MQSSVGVTRSFIKTDDGIETLLRDSELPAMLHAAASLNREEFMRTTIMATVSAGFLLVAAGQSDALPLQSMAASTQSPLIVTVAEGCGPGLVRGRHGTCLVRRAIFSHGRIVRKGCGKPIGAQGLRTPC